VLSVKKHACRIRVKSEKRGESTSFAPDGVARVGPVNHLLHSMFKQIDIYFNQKLMSLPNNTYAYCVRSIIKLCFTRKNFPSNFLLTGRGYSRLHGRHIKLVKSKCSARDTRNIVHSRKSRSKSNWSPSLRHFQSR